jgi:hypothetical protein
LLRRPLEQVYNVELLRRYDVVLAERNRIIVVDQIPIMASERLQMGTGAEEILKSRY